jgi:hypothetical protein
MFSGRTGKRDMGRNFWRVVPVLKNNFPIKKGKFSDTTCLSSFFVVQYFPYLLSDFIHADGFIN